MAHTYPTAGGYKNVGGYAFGLTADTGSAQDTTSTLKNIACAIFDTVGTAGDSATLPSPVELGTRITVKNNAASNSMDLFPNSGETINGGSADAAKAIAAGACITLVKASATNWEEISDSAD